MTNWVLNIPVISTVHIPGYKAMDTMMDVQASASDKEGCFNFVHLEELGDECGDWLDPISDWVYEKYDTYWVRFDPDGDIIPELPTYEDRWT